MPFKFKKFSAQKLTLIAFIYLPVSGTERFFLCHPESILQVQKTYIDIIFNFVINQCREQSEKQKNRSTAEQLTGFFRHQPMTVRVQLTP